MEFSETAHSFLVCVPGESSPDVSSAEGGKSSSFYCHYCGVALNSTQQLEEHREGTLYFLFENINIRDTEEAV